MKDDKGNDFYDPGYRSYKSKRKKSLKDRLKPIQEGATQKDNLYQCHYCNKELTWETVTVDHKKPLSAGGSNHSRNLVPACYPCNNKKRSSNYEQFMRWKNLLK